MTLRELPDGTIVEIPAAEEAAKLAEESSNTEESRKETIKRLAKERIVLHIASEDDQSEMIIRLLLAITDIGRELVAKNVLTAADLSTITKTLNSRAQDVLDVRSATQASITGGDSVEEFETILDGLIPSPVI